jgi:formylglycine-generating enzyme required for sulfatase activity
LSAELFDYQQLHSLYSPFCLLSLILYEYYFITDFCFFSTTLVWLSASVFFYIGVYEVTQAQYSAVMGSNPSEFQSANGYTDDDQRPVESVSYNDITTANTGFLAQINSQLASQIPSGYRFDLPTEAQWEYACRAKTTTALNSGKNLEKTDYYDSNLNEVAWYYFNSPGNTCSVGIKQPNAWGLYDMHGNVWEWCKDRYNQNYYTTCGDCSDPVGPDTGSSRVRRGGSWNGSPDCCRSAGRYNNNPSSGNNYVGFRLVLVHE